MQLQTLTAYLRYTAEVTPNHGIHYVHENGFIEKQTYAELLSEAYELACGFRNDGKLPGEKVIIATLTNRQTITSLWGCFFAGLIPTILTIPVSLTDKSQSAEKILNVYENMDHPIIIISKPIPSNDQIPESDFRLYEKLTRSEGLPDFEAEVNDLAFIQYSSGSTGNPKGICLTHANLAWNINSITIGLQIKQSDNFGNWMPLYHDMGLIGYHLNPIVNSLNQYHIETIDFIKNPSIWLDMLSKARIAVTGCPNFSLALTLRYLQRKKTEQDWDFSSMKAMLNGAEPISVKIMEEFTSALKKYNLPDYAMMPVYGMAEVTLAVSFTPVFTPRVVKSFDTEELDRNGRAVPVATGQHKHTRQLAAVGIALSNLEIRIVNDNDEPLSETWVGHIQIKSPSVTAGYYKNPEATAVLFCGEWMRTGDLGFFLDGYLYISGRHKDVIFMNGKKYFANDLETLAGTLEDIVYGKIAIGGYTNPANNKEKIVVFVASIPESKVAATLESLRVLFRSKLGVPIDEMVLLRSNEFPKTSSGKTQRYLMVKRYIQGEYTNRYN